MEIRRNLFVQNEFPVPVMKIRRNPFVVRPIAATVQSIHIAIARKRKHRVKKKTVVLWKQQKLLETKEP